MKKDRIKITGEKPVYNAVQRLERGAVVLSVLTALMLAAVPAAFFFIRAGEVSIDPSGLDYPTAYSLISGSDVTPSDIEERADTKIYQFREFGWPRAFEDWLFLEEALSDTEGYSPDPALTGEARADYLEYLRVVRQNSADDRAFNLRVAVCVGAFALAGLFVSALAVNRLLKLRAEMKGPAAREEAFELGGDDEYNEDRDDYDVDVGFVPYKDSCDGGGDIDAPPRVPPASGQPSSSLSEPYEDM